MNLLVLSFTLFIKVFNLFDVVFDLMVNSTSVWDTLFGISLVDNSSRFVNSRRYGAYDGVFWEWVALSSVNMWVSVNKRYIRCLMVGMS